MLLMFERGIRGGITQTVHRYASANNKYMGPPWSGDPGSHSNPMGDLYDSSRKSRYLQYLNANNLYYGWAMSQLLPTGNFRWVNIDPSQIHNLITSKIKGYLLEVDIRYPTELHNSHNDLPFMCERMEINKVEKLVPNLRDKKNHVIHIRALDQDQGMGWYLNEFIERLGSVNPIE